MTSTTADIPIVARGRNLYRDNERFFVKGVVYRNYNARDSISDDCLPQLEQDAALFEELGINTLHVYRVDPTKAHEQAMKLLEDAGIYVYLSISSLPCIVHRMKPYESYNPTTLRAFFDVVDCLAPYPNIVGISVANELINNDKSMVVAPVLKAVVRDVKRYMRLKHELTGQRILPVGYSAAMSNEREKQLLEYLASGDDSSSLDLWACVNFFSHKNPDNIRAEYGDMAERFENFAIPMFISEYGNNFCRPRQFPEMEVMYSSAFTRVFSGGCVYEYLQGANDYGLVDLLYQDGDQRSELRRQALARAEDPKFVAERRPLKDKSLIIYHDFVNYKAALAAVNTTVDVHGLESVKEEVEGNQPAETGRISGLWKPESAAPETCVDWEDVEKVLRANAASA